MKKLTIVTLMILVLNGLSAQQEKVRLEKGKLYLGNQELTRKGYKTLILKNEEALSHYKHQSTANAFAYTFAVLGGSGLGYGSAGLLFNKNPNLTIAHSAILGGGILFTTVAFVLDAAGRSSLKKSISTYNGNSQPISIQLKSSANEIGIVAHF